MSELLIYFFIGISLSIDAFSIAISLSTTNIDNKDLIKLPLMVGLFHFCMPLLGIKLGNLIDRVDRIESDHN